MDQQNNEILKFMRNRRSVPAKLMGGPGPDESVLLDILTIASRVPDHGKLCAWRFIQYGNNKARALGKLLETRARELATLENQNFNDEQAEIERHRFLRTPIVIGVVCTAKLHPKIPLWEQELGSAAVAMNMLIAANAHGFDAQWLTEWYAYDEEMHRPMGLRDGERITAFIHIGTRKMPKTQRDRPDINNLITILD